MQRHPCCTVLHWSLATSFETCLKRLPGTTFERVSGKTKDPSHTRGVSATRLGGHATQPLPSHAVTADQQAGNIIGERSNNIPRGSLGKPVRKLVERVALAGPNVLKSNIKICLAMGNMDEQRQASWAWPPTLHNASTTLEENKESMALHTLQGGQEITTQTRAQSTAASSIVLLSPTGSR